MLDMLGLLDMLEVLDTEVVVGMRDTELVGMLDMLELLELLYLSSPRLLHA